jgi:hypothetical protein
MPFFTSQELFGNGAGSPGDPGWVPVDTAAPPTFSANNRGIAFGEQLTSAIANRSHYALALNDDDLNDRLAAFETSGLDAAYRCGAVSDPSSGRFITTDGGAVEAQSGMAFIYTSDIANAMFRADATNDVTDGGGGFDFAGFGLSTGVASFFGYLDRRVLSFTAANGTTFSLANAVTLNPGAAGATQLSLNAGTMHTGGVTAVALGLDLVEVSGTGPVSSGGYDGLYIVDTLVGGQNARCTLRNLDGTLPTFPANTVAAAAFYRPKFGSYSQWGSNNSSNHRGLTLVAMPTETSPLDVYGSAVSSIASTYLARFRHTLTNGTPNDVINIHSSGTIESLVDSDSVSSTLYNLGTRFGAAAMYVRQDEGTNPYETGFAAMSAGDLISHFGVIVQGDKRPASSPTGIINFNFINSGGYNVDLTDVTAADWNVHPSTTLVEVLTPTAQQGIYLVTGRDTNTGRITLEGLGGQTVSLPVAGAGTLRLLFGTTLGLRQVDVGFSSITAGTSTRTAAVIEAPGTDDGTALMLVTGGVGESALIRGVSIEDGGSQEVFHVNSGGGVYGSVFTSKSPQSGGFVYENAVTRRYLVSLADGLAMGGASPGWGYGMIFTDGPLWLSLANSGTVVFPLNSYLREGMIITDVRVMVTPGAARAGTNRLNVSLCYTAVDFNSPYNNPIAQTVLASVYDDASLLQQRISLASALGAGHTVVRDNGLGSLDCRDYHLMITAGNTAGTALDAIYGIQLVVSDPGPRNF